MSDTSRAVQFHSFNSVTPGNQLQLVWGPRVITTLVPCNRHMTQNVPQMLNEVHVWGQAWPLHDICPILLTKMLLDVQNEA